MDTSKYQKYIDSINTIIEEISQDRDALSDTDEDFSLMMALNNVLANAKGVRGSLNVVIDKINKNNSWHLTFY